MTSEMITETAAEIRLNPEGVLVWPDNAEIDWRERLFRLGAGPERGGDLADRRFWRMVARRFLLDFQQAAADFWSAEEFEGRALARGKFSSPDPDPEQLAELTVGAPPIAGGEYLEEGLPAVWADRKSVV